MVRSGGSVKPVDVYAGFAAFGGFWGAWGASIPAVRDQAGVGTGRLGTALLAIAVGALPAMLLSGRLVDRWPSRATAAVLVGMGLAGVGVAVAGHDLISLSIGLAVLGATSGAADVGLNSLAGGAQQVHGRPVISRAHACFSAAVVVGSLGAGVLLGSGMPLAVVFLLVAAGTTGAAVRLAVVAGPTGGGTGSTAPAPGTSRAARSALVGLATPLAVVGGLGTLAYAVENAHQSWSALYLRDVLSAGPVTAAAGPAVFAAIAAVTRGGTGDLGARRPRPVVVAGATIAAIGTGTLALAPNWAVGLVGIALAAAGTAALFPTLLGALNHHLPPDVRGTATSIVTTTAYLGFLAGPGYVGHWADAVGLPGAMLAVAVVAQALALLAAAALPMVTSRPPDHGSPSTEG